MSVLPPVRPVFRAATRAMLPRAADLDEDGWRGMEQTIEAALGQRSRRVQRQFRIFLRILDLGTIPSHRKRFHRLDDATRLRVLEQMERGPRLLLRRGVWGLRTLVFMAYYTQPAHAAAIGYRASPEGWAGRQSSYTPAAPATTPASGPSATSAPAAARPAAAPPVRGKRAGRR